MNAKMLPVSASQVITIALDPTARVSDMTRHVFETDQPYRNLVLARAVALAGASSVPLISSDFSSASGDDEIENLLGYDQPGAERVRLDGTMAAHVVLELERVGLLSREMVNLMHLDNCVVVIEFHLSRGIWSATARGRWYEMSPGYPKGCRVFSTEPIGFG